MLSSIGFGQAYEITVDLPIQEDMSTNLLRKRDLIAGSATPGELRDWVVIAERLMWDQDRWHGIRARP